ncbi:MAG: glycosyltransferase family 4 protein [Verrucomicrobiota bacterium]
MSWLRKIRKTFHRSELVILDDGLSWALGQEIHDLSSVLKHAGKSFRHEKNGYIGYAGDALYYADHFYALTRRPENRGRRIALSYYHGRPGRAGEEFTEVFEKLKARVHEIERVRVTHTEMKQWMVNAGMAEEYVHQIPIGISTDLYPLRQKGDREAARQKLGLSSDAFVVGSFQKDGTGWGEGMEPKLIKGPDVFLDVMQQLKSEIPELAVLLSGPARGYVKEGLTRLGIPMVHTQVDTEVEMIPCYYALDAYLITSRQEGGPKSLLESMATGVPVVATRCGQCSELVQPEVNGWIVDVEDVEGIVDGVLKIYGMSAEARQRHIEMARQTAEANDHLTQTELWMDLFNGFAPGIR